MKRSAARPVWLVSLLPLVLLLLLLLALAPAAGVRAQGVPAVSAEKKTNSPPSPAEREAKFRATLSKATLSGRWCGIQNGKLTPEKEDKYSIVGVTRGEGDAWLIHSRIQYAGKDFVAPIPVQVKWAGDTAVITLDNINIPGSGSFTARVLIHEDTYAGSWSGGGHAGLLSGVITRARKATP